MLIVVPMRVLFPKKKENRSARFAKAATLSYLVDVSPTHSFARCVGLVGRLGLGRAHVRMDSSRLYSSSKPISDPARSPTCVRLSPLFLFRNWHSPVAAKVPLPPADWHSPVAAKVPPPSTAKVQHDWPCPVAGKVITPWQVAPPCGG